MSNLKKNEKKLRIILIITLATLLVIGITAIFFVDQKPDEEITEIKIFFSDENNNEGLVDCDKTRAVIRTIPETENIAYSAIEQMFIGPTEEEMNDGLIRINANDEKISDVIKRIFVIDNTVYIDWYDFSQQNSVSDDKPFFYNSSSGGCNVIPPIENTLKNLPDIENVIYAFEGDPEKYYNWIQIGCAPEESENKCDPTPFM